MRARKNGRRDIASLQSRSHPHLRVRVTSDGSAWRHLLLHRGMLPYVICISL